MLLRLSQFEVLVGDDLLLQLFCQLLGHPEIFRSMHQHIGSTSQIHSSPSKPAHIRRSACLASIGE